MELMWLLFFQSQRMRNGLQVSSPAALGWRIRRHWIFSCSPCGLTGRSGLGVGPGESSNAVTYRKWKGCRQSGATQQAVRQWVRWVPRRKIVKTLLRDESGQTLIFVAVSMTVILGFLAMAADV